VNRSAYLKQFHKFQQNRELHFAPKIKSAIKEQYSQFIKAKSNGLSDAHALEHITSTSIQSAIKPIYHDAIHYGSLIYSQLPKSPKKLKRRAPIGFNDNMVRLINQYFNSEILNTSEGITETTRDTIRVIMQIANEEGRSINWVVDNLVTETQELTRNRARLIARTETVTATNGAGNFAAKQTGLKYQKEWLATMDSRVRPDHANVNGSRVNMEDYFLVGDSQMSVPGARVQKNGLPTPAGEVCNCRCTCLYLPQKNAQGQYIEQDYGVVQMFANAL
jgi:uncharacterized protein with gpF-like domain